MSLCVAVKCCCVLCTSSPNNNNNFVRNIFVKTSSISQKRIIEFVIVGQPLPLPLLLLLWLLLVCGRLKIFFENGFTRQNFWAKWQKSEVHFKNIKMAISGLFKLFLPFLQFTENIYSLKLMMAGFKPWSSCTRSDWSANGQLLPRTVSDITFPNSYWSVRCCPSIDPT